MKNWILAAAVSGALLPAAASAIQTAEDEIVITGETRKQAQRKAQAYVRQLGVAAGEKQAARWIVPICPRAIGLGADHSAMVEKRVRRIAEKAGAPVAPQKCEANLVVAFTDDSGAVIDRITRLDSAPTRRMSPAEARHFKTAQSPVRWWYNTAVQSSDSVSESTVLNPSVAFTDLSGNRTDPPVNDRSTMLAQYNSSLVSTQAVRAIQSATVIVDVERASGTSLASIIDYAALVGLAEIKLGAAPEESILSLFKPEAVKALSSRDEAFLKGLYKITLDRRADQQQRTLVGQMVKETAAN